MYYVFYFYRVFVEYLVLTLVYERDAQLCSPCGF